MALINGIYLFVEGEDVTRSAVSSEHPVEEGIDLTDNVRRSPVTLSLTGEIVGDGYGNDVAELDAMMRRGELVEYVGVHVLSGMMITEFKTTGDGSIRGGCRFTMGLKEVRIAASPYAAGSVGTGEQQVEQEPGGEQSKSQARTHTVKNGDTLWGLAKSYYGNGGLFPQIFEANRDKLTDPNVIVDGQVLVIP